MTGNITKRGRNSWRIKLEAGHDATTGMRKYHVETLHGTKADAAALLAKRIAERGERQLVQRTNITVAGYAEHWLLAIAPAKASGKTLERYGELLRLNIVPALGHIELQKLEAGQIESFYARLAKSGRRDGKGGLSPQTRRHIHKLLGQVLASAVMAGKIYKSPMARVQTAPRVQRAEIRVLDEGEFATLIQSLEGKPLFYPVLLAWASGVRRGELLGLRWQDVDFNKGTIRITQAVELVGWTVSIKVPKTSQSRRVITLPASAVQALKAHWGEQAEHCLRLGCGRFELVFPTWDGRPQNPNNVSKQFADAARVAGIRCRLHDLRHSHITHLLRAGVPVHVASARAGHASAKQTLDTYAHLLPGQQEAAAAAFDEALRKVLK
jgi:integrase